MKVTDMTDQTLDRCCILVVEDEYYLADELALELADNGATVLGPVPNVCDALALIDRHSPDGAILDVNLGGEPAFPLADMLIGRGVPLVFTTGYDREAMPERFAHVPRCEKPVNVAGVARALCEAIHA